MVYITTLEVPTAMPIHLFMAHQVQNQPTLAALLEDKAITKISAKYSDYANVFFSDLTIELSKNTGMNKHTIKLKDEKQPAYKAIYILSLIELKTLKTYIEIHFQTAFIQPSKFLA